MSITHSDLVFEDKNGTTIIDGSYTVNSMLMGLGLNPIGKNAFKSYYGGINEMTENEMTSDANEMTENEMTENEMTENEMTSDANEMTSAAANKPGKNKNNINGYDFNVIGIPGAYIVSNDGGSKNSDTIRYKSHNMLSDDMMENILNSYSNKSKHNNKNYTKKNNVGKNVKTRKHKLTK